MDETFNVIDFIFENNFVPFAIFATFGLLGLLFFRKKINHIIKNANYVYATITDIKLCKNDETRETGVAYSASQAFLYITFKDTLNSEIKTKLDHPVIIDKYHKGQEIEIAYPESDPKKPYLPESLKLIQKFLTYFIYFEALVTVVLWGVSFANVFDLTI